MRARGFVVVLAVAGVLAGGVVSQSAVFAAGPAPGSVTAAAEVDRAAADRAFVRRLAGKDPRSPVRTAAWSALISSAPDEAVAQFLTSGFDFAVQRAAQARARNADFARRVLATHTAEYAPEVHAAASRAVHGSDADREAFARSGYAAAKERDRVAREATGDAARAIAAADRAYVAGLREGDPGAQVRAAAAWALRAGASDADLVEFFAYGWASGAALDLEMFRVRAADNDTAWRRSASRLVVAAQAAEAAAREASGEAAVQAREAAARAWREAGEATGPARSAWGQAQQVAEAQAENWRAVAAAAAAATGPNWSAIAGPAAANESEWAAERAWAAEQARFWDALWEQARAGEQAMNTG